MKLPRRNFLHLAACAAALPTISRVAWAQTYPSRPVRIIIGFAPGGVVEIVARLIGQWLSERLGQPFIIESRPGAASNIATEAVVRAPPDGYTLLLVTAANAINTTSYAKLNFNFSPRHRANRQHHPAPLRHGSKSIGSGQNGSRVHRLCQGQSRQAHHGFGWYRSYHPSGGRAV